MLITDTSLIGLWFVASIIVSVIANNRGRDWLRWFGISVLISPLFAGILVLVMPSLKVGHAPASVEDGTGRKCPMCAETIRREAVKCRFCGSELAKSESIGTG